MPTAETSIPGVSDLWHIGHVPPTPHQQAILPTNENSIPHLLHHETDKILRLAISLAPQSQLVAGGALGNVVTYPVLYTGDPSKEGMPRITIARHGSRSPGGAPRNLLPGAPLPGAINMGFTDGHAELVKLDDLWTYNWHRNWKTPTTRPP